MAYKSLKGIPTICGHPSRISGDRIKLGKLITNQDDIKGWRLDWGGDKAGLFWGSGNGWGIETLIPGNELTGNWEGFDLMEHLDCNGIDLYPNDEELVA